MSVELDRLRVPPPAAVHAPAAAQSMPRDDDAGAPVPDPPAPPPPSSPHPVQRPVPPPPPPDHGRAAYLVLAACSLAQAPIWGYSVSFGVFNQYYAAHSLRDASPGSIASIGTSQTGVMYLAVPAVLALLTRFPRLRAAAGPLGLVLAVASLAGSSAPAASGAAGGLLGGHVGPLIATQGVLYALGCALLFGAASLCLDDWFVHRKGFAIGVMWAAKSVVGGSMPLLVALLLARFGLETTLRAWAVASALLALPVLLLLRPRLPVDAPVDAPVGADAPAAPPAAAPTSLVFFRRPLFWMLMVGNVLQALGYQMPMTYAASYAASLGLDRASRLAAYTGPVLLALFSVASVPGSMVFGVLGDRLPATTVVLVSSAGSAVAVFALWYVSNATVTVALAPLVAFTLVYGFFAGGFSSTWSAVLNDIKRRDPAANTGLVFGMLMGGRGLGFLLSGPISGALLALHRPASASASASAAAAQYAPLILCTGATAILGAWGSLWSLGKPCRRLARRAARLARRC